MSSIPIDPLAERLEVVRTTLASDVTKRADTDLSVKWNSDVSDFASLRVFVSEFQVASSPINRVVLVIDRYRRDLVSDELPSNYSLIAIVIGCTRVEPRSLRSLWRVGHVSGIDSPLTEVLVGNRITDLASMQSDRFVEVSKCFAARLALTCNTDILVFCDPPLVFLSERYPAVFDTHEGSPRRSVWRVHMTDRWLACFLTTLSASHSSVSAL